MHCLDFLPLCYVAETGGIRVFERAGDGCCKNLGGSGAFQNPRTFGHRGAGGHHVIDDDDGSAVDSLRRSDAKGVVHIFNARFSIEADLRPGWPLADQHTAIQRKLRRKKLERGTGDQIGLVESALAPFGRMQRHRDDNGIDVTEAKLLDGFGQQLAQRPGSGSHGVVLQQMNESAQGCVVFTVGDGAIEIRGIVTTGLALSVTDKQLRGSQTLAAKHALSETDRRKGIETFRTDRQTGDGNQRGMTETAIGGKKDRRKTADNLVEGRDQADTRLDAQNSSFSRYGFTTAEDRPPLASAGLQCLHSIWLVGEHQ